jgi:N-methylhydantoinase A/oxoprolinase/acetone carboxylase beta subunit
MGHIGFIHGGLNVDVTIIGNPNRADVRREDKILRSKNIRYVVVVVTFSPIDVEHRLEEVVRAWIQEELNDVNVVCSVEGKLMISPYL